MLGFKDIENIYRRLRTVRRYSTVPCVVPEDVASHLWLVSLIAFNMSKDLSAESRLKVLSMALFHDLEEGISGDIIYPVKRFSPEVKTALDNASQSFVDSLTANMNNGNNIKDIWNEYKEGESEEAKIAKVADIISQTIPMLTEYDMGNSYSEAIISNMVSHLKDYRCSKDIMSEIIDLIRSKGININESFRYEWANDEASASG